MGVCNCSMFCCTLLYVHSSIAIILMGKRELIALLNLSSWCLVMVERLFLTVPRGCLQFVIVVFPDHTHLLFLTVQISIKRSISVPEDCLYVIMLPNSAATDETLSYIRHFICVFTVCQSTCLPLSRMERVKCDWITVKMALQNQMVGPRVTPEH